MTDFEGWIVEALKAHGGRASLLAVAEHIWNNHRDELSSDRRVFFDLAVSHALGRNEAATEGIMRAADQVEAKAWELA